VALAVISTEQLSTGHLTAAWALTNAPYDESRKSPEQIIITASKTRDGILIFRKWNRSKKIAQHKKRAKNRRV
jgi:hypothetical protein